MIFYLPKLIISLNLVQYKQFYNMVILQSDNDNEYSKECHYSQHNDTQHSSKNASIQHKQHLA
jgi:hypothetical protein